MSTPDPPTPSCSPADNHQQVSRVPVYVRVLDVNDNAPTFAANYETFVCESAKANQVGVAGKRNVSSFEAVRDLVSGAEVKNL